MVHNGRLGTLRQVDACCLGEGAVSLVAGRSEWLDSVNEVEFEASSVEGETGATCKL